MLKRLTGFAAMVAMMGAAVAQEAAKAAPKLDDNLFPTAIGNKWVYGIVGKDKEMSVTIVRSEKVGDRDCIVLEAAMEVVKDGKTAREVVAVEYIAMVKGEYIRVKMGDVSVVPPLPFLKAAVRKDDTWTANFELQATVVDEKTKQTTVEKAQATTVYTAGTETITVPAGKFDCLTVKAVTTEDGKVTRSDFWYAKGIGPVRQEFDLGKDDMGKANKFALELKGTSSGGR